MAEHSGNWYPIGPVLWDATGKPYRATSDGQKDYIPPIVAAQYQDDPKLQAWARSQGANITYGPKDANGNPTTSDIRTGAPQGGFAGNYHWNSDEGIYAKDNFFDSSLGGLILGAGAVAAPFAASALAGAPTVGGGASSVADLGAVSPSAFGGASASVLPSAAGAVTDLGAVSPFSFAGAGVPDLGAVSSLPGLQGPLAGDVGNVIGPGISGMGTGPSASTATTLPDWLKTAQKTGDALSALSSGRAQGRLAEGNANQQQNNAAVNLYNTELNAPRTIARNAVKGDVLANAQDVHIDRPSTIPDFNISGGLRPSMFSDATRQTGRNISTAAAHTPIPSPTAPVLPDLPQAGGLDSFLNTASTISGLTRAVPPSAWGSIGRGLAGLF